MAKQISLEDSLVLWEHHHMADAGVRLVVSSGIDALFSQFPDIKQGLFYSSSKYQELKT